MVRIGLVVYPDYVTVLNIVLSAIVFCLFGSMFFKMFQKHVRRINGMEGKNTVFCVFLT